MASQPIGGVEASAHDPQAACEYDMQVPIERTQYVHENRRSIEGRAGDERQGRRPAA